MDNGKSDSANLDSVVELLVQSSKSPTEALMIMVPEAFRSQPALNSRPEVGVRVRVCVRVRGCFTCPPLAGCFVEGASCVCATGSSTKSIVVVPGVQPLTGGGAI